MSALRKRQKETEKAATLLAAWLRKAHRNFYDQYGSRYPFRFSLEWVSNQEAEFRKNKVSRQALQRALFYLQKTGWGFHAHNRRPLSSDKRQPTYFEVTRFPKEVAHLEDTARGE